MGWRVGMVDIYILPSGVSCLQRKGVKWMEECQNIELLDDLKAAIINIKLRHQSRKFVACHHFGYHHHCTKKKFVQQRTTEASKISHTTTVLCIMLYFLGGQSADIILGYCIGLTHSHAHCLNTPLEPSGIHEMSSQMCSYVPLILRQRTKLDIPVFLFSYDETS